MGNRGVRQAANEVQLTILSAAKRYTRLGWKVLPLEPGGKEPIGSLAPNGVSNATTVDAAIFGWCRRVPGMNLGVKCEQFLVVDIDPRHGGDRQMAEWVQAYGRLPETPVARTGGGGFHYLFQPVDFERRGKIGAKDEAGQQGIDILQGNRFIVVEPSATSGPYRWLRPPETPLAPLPAWLASFIRRPEAPPAVPVGPLEDIALERRIERARAYLERVEPAVSGQNGSARTLVAAQHVARGFALSLEQAFEAMGDWNQRCDPPWSDRELKRKIEQALREGRTVQPGQHLRK